MVCGRAVLAAATAWAAASEPVLADPDWDEFVALLWLEVDPHPSMATDAPATIMQSAARHRVREVPFRDIPVLSSVENILLLGQESQADSGLEPCSRNLYQRRQRVSNNASRGFVRMRDAASSGCVTRLRPDA